MNRPLPSLHFTILILIGLLASFAPHSSHMPVQCGFTESIEQASRIINAVIAFFSLIKSIITATGFNTLALFAAVTVISAGVTSFGLPRGRVSFLLSLATADLFWFAWEKSLNTSAGEYIPAMLKSNALVLAPLVTVALLTRAVPAIKKAIKIITAKLRGRKDISGEQAFDALMALDYRMNILRTSLLRDIKNATVLSAETLSARDSMIDELSKIKNGPGRAEGKKIDK